MADLQTSFPTVLDKLHEKSILDTVTNCRLWLGHTAGEGHGVIGWHGGQVYIHRLIYEQTYGYTPNVVRHTCDRPNCWQIEHLLDGSHADNVQDKVAKQRHCFGEKHYKARLTEAMVREIRASSLSLKQLVEKYGISKGAIHCALTRATWKHVL